MWDAALDLCLGSTCTVCQAPGRALCRWCAAGLPSGATAAWPTPTPPGLVRPSAAGEYAGALRALVLGLKEHGRLSLARPLGRLLAGSVADACRGDPGPGPGRAVSVGPVPVGPVPVGPVPVGLVPVPSHPSVVRARGQDPVTRTARAAASALRAGGHDARVLPLLRVGERPADQAGLDAGARTRNLQGRFRARTSAAGWRSWSAAPPALVLVDDVITTGSTLREAQRALEEAGLRPIGAAVVAATRRRDLRVVGGCGEVDVGVALPLRGRLD